MDVLYCQKISWKNAFFFPEFQSRTPVPVQNVSINSRRKGAGQAIWTEIGTFKGADKGMGMNERNQLVADRGKKQTKKAKILIF